MPEPHAGRGNGCLVIDLQGPFALNVKSYDTFVAVEIWPDVAVFITSAKEADDIIAALMKAKASLLGLPGGCRA